LGASLKEPQTRSDKVTVAAIVVTFNAPAALRACLESIQGQSFRPARLLVVDNGAEPAATAVLEKAATGPIPVQVLCPSENLGPAGGFAAGLAEFMRTKLNYAWLISDDCVTDPEALQRLMAVAKTSRGTALFPTQLNKRDVVENYPSWYGVLIEREIIRTIGLPRADLFWWVEDTEYLQWRIPRAGFQVVRVPEAIVRHREVRRRHRKPAWKFYYEVRNSVFYRLYIQRPRKIYKLGRMLTRTFLRILLIENWRGAKLRMFMLGLRDGFRGRLGKTMPADDQQF
jgi:rhamnopyranosyl-N-acetylglucosaminyl-diphospho-decaprenol beta-1,3/1,4-galactofuranosyltransferase